MESKKNEYDIPSQMIVKGLSKAFKLFYHHYFVDSSQLRRREADLVFLDEFTAEELVLARQLIRRNLRLRYVHLIEAVATLNDHDGIPQLRDMLKDEPNLSLRLTITGTLWKLIKDDSFIDCVNEMVVSGSETLKEAHINDVLLIGDVRAINTLMDLLSDSGRFVQFLALKHLNTIEHRTSFIMKDLPSSPDHYIRCREDTDFMAKMVEGLAWYNKTNKLP